MSEEESLPCRADDNALFEDALINLGHELRTPLAAIKGYTTTILRYDARLSVDERREMLGEINLASDRMEGLIDHLLYAARALRGDITMAPEVVDLVALTQQVLHHLGNPAHIIPVLSPPIPIWGDPHWLMRVMQQLIDNAQRYAPTTAAVHITVSAHDDMAKWSISDHGIGISAADIPHIFTPFYRVERTVTRDTSGLGLGLALCQRVVTLLGGTIGVSSVAGTGSRFWFSMPLYPVNLNSPN